MRSETMEWLMVFCIVYATLLVASLALLSSIPQAFEHRPELWDRQWKRVIWLMSCLLSVPFLVIVLQGACPFVHKIRNFIQKGE